MTDALARRTLLLVEDDQHLARSLVRMLTASGYEVVHIDRGDAAVECVQRQTFDVVVSDLGLPGASGLQVLAAARDADSSTMLILMSGDPTRASAAAAERLGVVAYLAKPLAPGELALRAASSGSIARPAARSPRATSHSAKW